MPLEIPNLDTETYERLVSATLAALPQQAHEWTDYNASDPGVTLIELFSWIADMQVYYVNRIRDLHYLKFLKILGFTRLPALPASFEAAFDPAKVSQHPVALPRGAKITVAGKRLETCRRFQPVGSRLAMLQAQDGIGFRDVTNLNRTRERAFFPFGEKQQPGAMLYLGMDQPLPPSREVCLNLKLVEDYPIPMGPVFPEEIRGTNHSAELLWEYGIPGDQWLPLDVRLDETRMFSYSGSICFTAPDSHPPRRVGNDERAYHYLRVRLVRPGFDLVPQVRSLSFNEIRAVRQETRIRLEQWVAPDSGEVIPVEGYLSYYGKSFVQVKNGKGFWEDWREAGAANGEEETKIYRLEKNETNLTSSLSFPAEPPPVREKNRTVRLISFLSRWDGENPAEDPILFIGSGDGLANRSFYLPYPDILGDRLLIQDRSPSGWRDWRIVDDFFASGPDDCHVGFDRETGFLHFGDGLKGRILPAPAPPRDSCRRPPHNLRIISLVTIERGASDHACPTGSGEPGPDLRPLLETAALIEKITDGRERESLAELRARVQRSQKTVTRAVTPHDHELLAKNTPGLRVAAARAYFVEQGKNAKNGAVRRGTIHVAVKPYSLEPNPRPSPRFLEMVREHLERRRLLCARVRVVPPIYIRVTIHIALRILPDQDLQATLRRITVRLQQFFDPLSDDPEGGAVGFGRNLFQSEILHLVQSVQGVKTVQRTRLVGLSPGDAGFREDSGNLMLSPQSFPYLETCDIHFTNAGDSPPQGGW